MAYFAQTKNYGPNFFFLVGVLQNWLMTLCHWWAIRDINLFFTHSPQNANKYQNIFQCPLNYSPVKCYGKHKEEGKAGVQSDEKKDEKKWLLSM